MNKLNQIENWRDIPNFEGLYQVSDLGNVKSLSKKVKRKSNGFLISNEKILKFGYKGKYDKKYLSVCLSKNSKVYNIAVHTLVAIAFLNHTPNGNKIEINHKDKNRLNNNLNNLEILSNMNHKAKDIDKSNTTSQYIGVYYNKKHKKWIASICFNSKKKHLGSFDTEIDAYDARLKAMNDYV